MFKVVREVLGLRTAPACGPQCARMQQLLYDLDSRLMAKSSRSAHRKLRRLHLQEPTSGRPLSLPNLIGQK